MTMWVIPGDAGFLAEALDRGFLEHPSDWDIATGDTLIIYQTDEEAVVGPFSASSGGIPLDLETADGASLSQVPFEIDEAVHRLPVERDFHKEEFAAGGRVDESTARFIRRRLPDAEETVDVDTADDVDEEDGDEQPAAREDLTLLDVSKAAEPIDVERCDFSGEEHGRLQLGGANLRGADLSYTDLEGTRFTGADLRAVDFRGADLAGADFSNAQLHRADFRGAKLSGATLDGNLTECRFQGAVLDEADLRRATIEEADLSEVRMRRAHLEWTNPVGASFAGSDLQGLKMSQACFEGASFRDADLEGTTFEECVLAQAIFDGANLREADLTRPDIEEASFVAADLTEADLEGQCAAGLDLSRATLTGANLQEVELVDARFAEARLTRTRFQDADLSGAVLTDAQASGAKFQQADLEHVVFTQAELFGADLTGAALYGAVLQSARIGGGTTLHGQPAEETGDESTSDYLVVYDSRADQPIPEGVVETPSPVEKAMSVYQTLETVMEANAYGDRAAEYFLNRKAMERRYHHQDGHLGQLASNYASWLTCGYGESFLILFGWAAALIGGLAFLYPVLGLSHADIGSISYARHGWLTPLYGLLFSLSTFTGLGYGDFDVDRLGEAFATTETGAGVLFFALLVFVLTKRVTR